MAATIEDHPPALEVRGLSHDYAGRRALKNVDIEVARGEFCLILGLNGAGKTTLFSLITRLFDSVSGEISVLGFDVRRQSSRALARLGVVFQSRTIDAELSVMQNMTYHGALHGLSRREARTSAECELARLGMAERAKDKARTLSGGQLRRVEIARALMHRPKLLLLDEPTAGLDLGSREAILAHLRQLTKEEGLGVLWATHLTEEAESSDKAYILHQGEVRRQGKVADIVSSLGESTLKGAFQQLTREVSP